MESRGNIGSDRAGGTSSSDASGKPPANDFHVDISYKPIIDSLSKMGFVDAESAECAYMVQHVHYDFLAYYFRVLLSDEPVMPSTKALHDLVTFDRRFQAITLKYIGAIESQLRAQYAHWMECEHGELALYDETLFTNPKHYQAARKVFDDEAAKAKRNNKVIREVAGQLDGKLPIGFAVQAMCLGTLSRFYKNTSDVDVTRRVAKSFGTNWNTLSNWLRAISDVRNVCAHFGAYLSRKQMPTTPRKIKDLDGQNSKPPYIANLLAYMLSGYAPFMDRNLDYAYRATVDYSALIGAFEKHYPHLMPKLGFQKCWRQSLEMSVLLGK